MKESLSWTCACPLFPANTTLRSFWLGKKDWQCFLSRASANRSREERNEAQGQWKGTRGERAGGDAAALGAPRCARADRYQVRLWDGAMRRLHRSPRWRRGTLLRATGRLGW